MTVVACFSIVAVWQWSSNISQIHALQDDQQQINRNISDLNDNIAKETVEAGHWEVFLDGLITPH